MCCYLDKSLICFYNSVKNIYEGIIEENLSYYLSRLKSKNFLSTNSWKKILKIFFSLHGFIFVGCFENIQPFADC